MTLPAHRHPAWLVAPAILLAAYAATADTAATLAKLKVPEGFQIAAYTTEVPGARSLALGSEGTVFVGTRGTGAVYAVRSASEGGARVFTIAAGLNLPNGVAYRDGALYVAEINRILRYDAIDKNLARPPQPVVVVDDLPRDRHHGWKYIAFGPDAKLYVPIGAPCNVCEKPGYAVITRMNADGTGREVYARGVRNTVGFTWHPGSRELWFTDNGRDWLGDDTPPCELNHAARAGLHFGFPFCHGGDIQDPELGRFGNCADATPPTRKLGAHVAPLGVKFYTGTQFPESYRNQLLIAEHGSWNRKERSGYRLMLVRLKGSEAISYEPFITGWNQPDDVLGRPVDLLVMPDGALLVSDDKAGVIYRVTYRAAG
jgi:glucose/arabinose dehydrogenase